MILPCVAGGWQIGPGVERARGGREAVRQGVEGGAILRTGSFGSAVQMGPPTAVSGRGAGGLGLADAHREDRLMSTHPPRSYPHTPHAPQTGVAKLVIGDRTLELPMVTGSESEVALDISSLRQQTGVITLDDGYSNTGSCESAITFIDGEQGVLRYRGYPIEQIAEKSNFLETAWLIIWGELPTAAQRRHFGELTSEHAILNEQMHHHFDGFPTHAHPMAILSAMLHAVSCYNPEVMDPDDEPTFENAAARLLSKVRTIAAASYKMSIGRPIEYPRPDLGYCENFLHMMFSLPHQPHEPNKVVSDALNLLLILHADHEQNCSTSTVRMVASSNANLFASCSAGVSALWGPLHGGANVAVIEMLEQIRRQKMSVKEYVGKVKDKTEGVKLMGFGHRVYKNFDPRAKIIKRSCDAVLAQLKISDPLLDLAKELEEAALGDAYFIERKLYPNVDFYSGIIMKAIGIPLDMFTVMFAIGRMPGWIANWREVRFSPRSRIYRPRQVYTGAKLRDYVPMERRG